MVVSISAGSGFLRAIITGEFSLDEAERTFLEIIAALPGNKPGKILVDGRELKGDPEAIERFLYGEFAADAVVALMLERGLSPAPLFAYVLKEPVLDPRRLGETAAVNRGMLVKAFDNLEEAQQWLSV